MGPFSTSFSRALNFCHAAPAKHHLPSFQEQETRKKYWLFHGSTGCPRKKVTDLVRASAKNLAQINHK